MILNLRRLFLEMDNKILNNHKILVVGAAGLLGSSLVRELLLAGAEVVAADLSKQLIKEKLSDLGIKSNNLTIEQINLLDKKSVSKIFKIHDDFSGAVNCSYPRNKNYGKHFFDVKVEDFNENISMNLGSSFLFMQECARYFQFINKPFSLVNISSIYGSVAPKFEIYSKTKMTTPAEYVAIKGGLVNLSKYVVKYINDSRFRINLVSPGGILDNQPSAFLKAYKGKTLGKGMLDSKDVLGSIIFLLSSMSQYINGQNLIIDDGFTL